MLTLFDDHCCQLTGGGTYVSPTAPSRAVELKLDQRAHTATLAAQYTHGGSFDADYMGSTQPLANGDVFVGWGSQPNFSEYSGSGKLLLDVVFPRPDLSYRANLEQWVVCLPPRPWAPPASRVPKRRCTRVGTVPPESSPEGSGGIRHQRDWPPWQPVPRRGSKRRSACARVTGCSRSRLSMPATV